MAKILGIIGSQRHLGNGEILVKAIADAAGPEHTLELLRLAEFNLLPCKACYKCTGTDGRCILDDDLNLIIDKMVEADAIIISTPTYVRGPAGILKTLGDRVIAIAQHLDQLYQKPTVVVATHGPAGDEGYALTAAVALARMMGLGVKDAYTYLGALPGECIQTEGNMERIQQMAQALFGQRRPAGEFECPYCGGNIWKFRQPNLAYCPICMTEDRMTVQPDGTITHTYGDSPTQVFGYDWLNNHFRADLSAGVKDFKAKNQALREIRGRYKRDDDHWIKKADDQPQ